jgi:Flp pilus assembly protein TadB
MRTLILRLLFIAALVPAAGAALGQEAGISKREQEKRLAQKAREDKKAKARKEKEDHARFLAIQDKATRKRIKQHTRRADRNGSGAHRDGFPARLFRRKR